VEVNDERTLGRPVSAVPRVRVIAVSAIVGMAVFIALLPYMGIVPIPPVCWSVFGYEVPCAGWVAPAAAGLAALVTAFLLSALGRRG
jgi:hypothetical protein